MAVGNTFGATALSSYGGFWLSFAIILTPGFQIETILEEEGIAQFHHSFGLFLMVGLTSQNPAKKICLPSNQGWFIFTFLLLLCTLKTTVAFFSLFFTLTLAFLMLGIAYLETANGAPHKGLVRAGGVFGLFAAFLAWYVALAGIVDSSNTFFTVPLIHMPWSTKGKEQRGKVANGHHTA